MSRPTAEMLKKMLATDVADRNQLDEAIAAHPPETTDQLLNLQSLKHSFRSHYEALCSALREFE
jgi:ferritin-like metal-binding protein YciE